MGNKVLAGLGMAAVIGLMVAGVAYAVAGGQGNTGRQSEAGRWWADAEAKAAGAGARWSAEGGEGGGGQGGGRWRISETAGLAGRWPGEGSEIDEPPVALEDLQSTRGVVESIAGTDLVLRTDAGASVGISLGQPAYWEAQGVSLAVGEAVLVEGYEEDDGTLAASTVTVVATGQTVVLRDGVGRPMWSGGRRNAGARRAPAL